jgi:hypothetical protein
MIVTVLVRPHRFRQLCCCCDLVSTARGAGNTAAADCLIRSTSRWASGCPADLGTHARRINLILGYYKYLGFFATCSTTSSFLLGTRQ